MLKEVLKDKKKFSIKKISMPTTAILILCLLLVIFFIMIKAKGASIEKKRSADIEKKENMINVVTMTLKPTDIKDKLNLLAQTQAWSDFNIVSEVAGVVFKKNLAKGGFVNKGDVIVTIDFNKYKNAFDSAYASYDLAINSYNRILKLYEKQSINKDELDKVKAGFEMAKVNLNNAEIDLKKCKIKAPSSGFIDSIFVEEGEFVKYGEPIARIIDYDNVKVVVNVPEAEVFHIKDVNKFTFTIDALGGKTFKGEKYFISKIPDNLAKVYHLEIKVANKDRVIFPGMFVRVEIVKKDNKKAIVIPITSVTNTKEGNFVFVEHNGVGERRQVKLGISEGFYVEISEGLSLGEKIIVIKQGDFNDANKVKVIKNVESLKELNDIGY